MRRHSDELFELIKSLSKTEKSYFKKFTSKHIIGEKNNYMKLFEVMEKQKEDDEKALIKSLDGEDFVNHLSRVKNYLHDLILKSLISYHSERSVNAELMELMRKVEVLWSKRLYDQCEKLLRKARKIAHLYDFNLALLDIMKWEQQIAYEKNEKDQTIDQIEEKFKEQVGVLEAHRHLIEFDRRGQELSLMIFQSGESRTQESIQKYKKIFESPEIQINLEKSSSFRIKISYYLIHFLYYSATGENEKALDAIKKLVELYNANEVMIRSDLRKYIITLHNYIAVHIQLHKMDSVLADIQRLRNIQQEYEDICTDDFNMLIDAFSYMLELRYYIKLGQFKEKIETIRHIEDSVKEIQDDPYRKPTDIELLFLMAMMYFGAQQYKKSLLYVNRILNNKEFEHLHLYSRTLILNLIIHFELKNYELLDYVIKTTYRKMSSRKQVYQSEEAIFSYLKKIFTAITSDELRAIELFHSLKDELLQYYNDPFESKAFTYFDILAWIEAKLENRSYEEMVKVKLLQHKVLK